MLLKRKLFFSVLLYYVCLILSSCKGNTENLEQIESNQRKTDSIHVNNNVFNFNSDSIKIAKNNTWSIFYGSERNIGNFQKIEPTNDNGCVFTTIADVETNDGIRTIKKRVFKLFKVDSLGTMEWVKEVSYSDFPSLAVTKNNNYLIATENKLQLYDNAGNLKIVKDFSSSKLIDYLNNVYCFSENEILLVGKMNERGVILKFDKNLNLIANNIFGNEPERKYYSDGSYDIVGSPEYSEITSIARSSEGTFFFTGKKKDVLWIGHVDEKMQLLWEKNNFIFRQNGKRAKEGNTIIYKGDNNIYVSSTYSDVNTPTLLFCFNAQGNILWKKAFRGQIGKDHKSLMEFNDSLYLITFDSERENYSTKDKFYSNLFIIDFQGELKNHSTINLNGIKISAKKIVSNNNNYYFLLSNNKLYKFNSSGNISETTFDYSEKRVNDLKINLDFNKNEQLRDFLSFYNFHCEIGNSYFSTLTFSPNYNNVNSGKVQFSMFKRKGTSFDIVTEKLYSYSILKNESENRIYFNTGMNGEVFLDPNGNITMNDISRKERYYFYYKKR